MGHLAEELVDAVLIQAEDDVVVALSRRRSRLDERQSLRNVLKMSSAAVRRRCPLTTSTDYLAIEGGRLARGDDKLDRDTRCINFSRSCDEFWARGDVEKSRRAEARRRCTLTTLTSRLAIEDGRAE